jgi:hypothetical protein
MVRMPGAHDLLPCAFGLDSAREVPGPLAFSQPSFTLSKSFGDVESGIAQWVQWCEHRRLFEPIGDVPPAPFDAGLKPNALVSKTPMIQCVVTQ